MHLHDGISFIDHGSQSAHIGDTLHRAGNQSTHGGFQPTKAMVMSLLFYIFRSLV